MLLYESIQNTRGFLVQVKLVVFLFHCMERNARGIIWDIDRSNIYILFTKCIDRTRKISARGLDSTDQAQRGSYGKDRGPIFY